VSALIDVARRGVEVALARGANAVAASTYRQREVGVDWRDGRLEKISEATTRGLSLELYVDGRYAAVATSDLRPDAIERFLEGAIAMTRTLSPDPFRSLPEPALYAGQAGLALELEDPAYGSLTSLRRRELAAEVEAAAREVKGGGAIISVTASCSDSQLESSRVHSNGFEGQTRQTSFWLGAEVSVQDPNGRKPEESDFRGARMLADMPDAAEVGRAAAERAFGRIGSTKGRSGTLPMVVDARASSRILRYLLAPLGGGALQQKQSYLEGKLGQAITSPVLTITDDPHIPKGFGSRLYDSEGIAARKMPVLEAGVLRNYYIDHYYAQKLGLPVTTRGSSNLTIPLGKDPQPAHLAAEGEGILETGLLGGNSNTTTGDFSLGVQGFAIEKGKQGAPIGEMNISGNHLDLWTHLTALGNDPYPYTSVLSPTLVFDAVQFAGT
jgi:PmbA protein